MPLRRGARRWDLLRDWIGALAKKTSLHTGKESEAILGKGLVTRHSEIKWLGIFFLIGGEKGGDESQPSKKKGGSIS